MKALWRRLDRWWLLIPLLWLLPFAALLPIGLLWLREAGLLLVWVGLVSFFGAAGYGLHLWLARGQRRELFGEQTRPNPDWPPAADGAWALVEALAERVDPEDWPLEEGMKFGLLAQQTLEEVAGYFHPEVDQPLLELTLPHGLLIIERASRDLRESITEHIPFSHRLSVGAVARAYRWKPFAERLLGLYRVGQWVVNPTHALLSEAWQHLRGHGYAMAREDLHRWLLREFVRKVGTYAIELYSGRLLLSDTDPVSRPTVRSAQDLKVAVGVGVSEEATQGPEPLRILVLGRSNSGKSSLINALFGQLRAATDLLPATTGAATPYRLEREGLEVALIFDTPGAEQVKREGLRTLAEEADMILWASAAHRADRRSEREALDALRAELAARSDRRPPPLLVVLTHIDRLRPPREWRPPYDLSHPADPKSKNIAAAVAAVAGDLEVPIAKVIPVCLAEGRVYNVDDTLWVAMLEQMDQAQRVRLLRCQDARRREENWALLGRQLATAGRLLLALPRRMAGGPEKAREDRP